MEKSTSQKIVKVLGVLSIIGAVLCLIGAAGMFGVGGFGALSVDPEDSEMATGVFALFLGGFLLLISGISELVQGVFSLRAAKDARKATPLWVISIISLILSVIALVSSFGKGSQEVLSAVFSVIVSAVILYLANNIKKQGRGML